ncbi:MAG TPA: hypothetical protein VFE93_16630 [Myxococcaceae bacterium]|jgi:hypothetical protein|nr:hypothetical protein [Myxococcaceae bacterium]
MIKRLLVSSAVLLGAAGIACGGDSGTTDLPPKPQIVTDRDSIVDQAIFAGQQKNQTLQLTNKGQQDLVVSGFTLQADSGWNLSNTSPALFQEDGTQSATVKSNKTAFINMNCKPTTAGQTITGTLTITSNAENKPTKAVSVSCGPAVAP